MDIDVLARAVISMLVITAPIDPVKILFFNQAIAGTPRKRTAAALQVALNVIIVLGGAALVGRQLLNFLGVDLHVFSAVGGLIIALLGFEMLHGGTPSKTQGGDRRQRGPDDGDALLIPLTIPLIAGPGAITTTITLAAQDESWSSVIVALIGVGVVALAAFIGFAWLGGFIGRAKPSVLAVLVRLGGLLLATIGTQMMLGGLKAFFAT